MEGDLKDKILGIIEGFEENKRPKFEVRMSMIGGCLRKMDYDYQFGPSPIDAIQWLRFEVGHLYHKLFQDVLEAAFPFDFHGMEEEVKLKTPAGHELIGHPDGEIESLDAIIEVKSVSSSSFKLIKNNNEPFDQHISQANIYAKARGRSKMLFIYINKDNQNFELFLRDHDPGRAIFDLENIDLHFENRKTNTISPRLYANKTKSPCYYCDHKDRCYEGFQDEYNNLNEKDDLVQDQDISEAAALCFDKRKERLKISKEEGKLMDKVVKAFTETYGLRHGYVSHKDRGFEVKIKTSKNDFFIGTIKELKNGRPNQ